jgi:hypothetical protein
MGEGWRVKVDWHFWGRTNILFNLGQGRENSNRSIITESESGSYKVEVKHWCRLLYFVPIRQAPQAPEHQDPRQQVSTAS